jgi:hypothetical protein
MLLPRLFNEAPISTLHRAILVSLLLFFGIAESAAASGSPLPRIGWVYRLEGNLDGQPVVYVGSAADLKQRLTNNHKWANAVHLQ